LTNRSSPGSPQQKKAIFRAYLYNKTIKYSIKLVNLCTLVYLYEN